jgi:hypothetical protein
MAKHFTINQNTGGDTLTALFKKNRMSTRKICILLLMVGVTSIMANAQKDRKEIIKEEKMVFINDYCKFTDDEVKKFWPLHDEMQEKLKEIRKTMRRELRDIKDKGVDSMTDAELKRAFDNRKGYEQKLQDIKWDYNDKFIGAVGLKKTAKFYEGEVAFRKKLLDRLKDLKMDGKGGDEDEDN